jgi:hypothetical protein
MEAPMRRFRFVPTLLSILLLVACTQKESSQASSDSNQPHATILLRDGTNVMGRVTSSTPSEISLNLDGGGSRTILTRDVKSVEYGEAAPAGKVAAQPANESAKNSRPTALEPRNKAERESEAPARYHPDRTAIQTKTFEVPSGTEISVRNNEAIDSSKAVEGQSYAGDVTADVRDANGAVVIPSGANAQMVIKSMTSGGKIRGASDLVIALQSVSIDGQQYAVHTTDIQKEGSQGIGINKRTGEYVGGGAALGAIIGAIAGQGKGAAIGAAAGAGGGALTQILTKGNSIKVPAETLMTFRLDQSLRVVERK